MTCFSHLAAIEKIASFFLTLPFVYVVAVLPLSLSSTLPPPLCFTAIQTFSIAEEGKKDDCSYDYLLLASVGLKWLVARQNFKSDAAALAAASQHKSG